MILTQSSVGRKILMAVTGLILVSFVCVHLLGNLSLFAGADAINAYAAKLQSLGPIVWIFRLVMLAVFTVHVGFGIQLSVQNSAARPIGYMQKVNERATFSSRSMIVTGGVLFFFIILHLAHFTGHVGVNVADFAGKAADGHFNVYGMVVAAFKSAFFFIVYAVGMLCLFLHLTHGVGSFFQSLGLTNENTLDGIGTLGKVVSFVLLVGYFAVIICGASA